MRELPPEAADAFVEVGGPGSGSPLLMLELRQLGGALAEAPDGAGALGALTDPFTLYGVGLPMADGMAEAIVAHIERVQEVMAPWSAGVYLNFSEMPSTAADAFDDATYARLREVKARYDAGDLFRSNHPV
jgi:Berberine and berberine like